MTAPLMTFQKKEFPTMTRNRHTRRFVLSAGAAAGVFWPTAALPAPAQPRQSEGGIGGTGIVGILTEFGSLIVAGRRVQMDGLTRYTDGFGDIGASDVVIGDSLTIEANGPVDNLTARRVHVTHPLVGEVTAVGDAGRSLTILGTTVRLARPNRLARVGQRVAVSGLWRGNSVEASGLSPARDNRDLVAGTVDRAGFGVTVSGVRVRGTGSQQLEDGGFGSIVGRYDPESGLMRSERAGTARFTGAAGPLKRLAVEGYLEPTRTAPGYRIAGLGHSFARNIDLSPYAQERTLFLGNYTGLFAAREALVLPEDPTARARILGAFAR